MKACVLESVGQLVYKDVDRPKPGKNQVLLEIKACGICSSDIDRVFKTGTYHFPTIPGHEFSGKIIETGDCADRSLSGRRVVVFPLLPCGKCHSCMEGQYARCENYDYFGSRRDGAFAEYLAIPEWNIIPFSDSLDYKTAALCEPAAVALHSVHATGGLKGKTAVIVGTGTIAFLTAVWAEREGAKKIIMLGRTREKEEFAQSLCIDNFTYIYEEPVTKVLEETDGCGPDVVFECVGGAQTAAQAVSIAGKGGTVILTGNPPSDICLDRAVYWKILRNELTMRGTWNSSFNDKENDWRMALDYMEHNQAVFRKLITHTFDLKHHREAFDVLRDSDIFSVKAMFVM